MIFKEEIFFKGKIGYLVINIAVPLFSHLGKQKISPYRMVQSYIQKYEFLNWYMCMTEKKKAGFVKFSDFTFVHWQD